MKLHISVNPSDGLPVYRQIVQQIKGAIGIGKLKPGDQLPGHRELSAELVVAPMTIKKAYDVLRQESLITMGSGKGTFVSEDVSVISKVEKIQRIQDKTNQLIIEALLLDIPLEDLKKHLDTKFKQAIKKRNEK